MNGHSPRRSNLHASTQVSHAAAETMELSAASAPSVGCTVDVVREWCSWRHLAQAGMVNDSPLVKTAQASLAFLAATATTAFQ